MKKNFSVFISIILSLLVFVAGFAAFAQELSPKGEGHIDPILVNAQNTAIALDKTSYVFDGKEKCPKATVTYTEEGKKNVLENGIDYYVTYQNNTAPGKATVVVTFGNKYSGTLNSYFTIAPAKTVGIKADSRTYSSFRALWTKQSGVSGYEIKFTASGEAAKNIDAAASADSYIFRSLTSDTIYSVAVRSYVTVDSKRVYGAYSDIVKVATKKIVGSPKVNGYCSLTSRPTLEWKKVKKAKKYVIYRSTSKNGEYKKIGTTKALSFADKKAKMHKTYYYKVKALRRYRKKNYLSKASEAVKVKALKTVLVGDSVLESVQAYKTLPAATYVVKIGMGTYTFYSSYYYKVGGKPATGCEKVISCKPDRVIMMFGMNETAYKGNSGILEYYKYAIDDIKAARKGVEIILLPVSPTKPTSDKSIPKKKRINSFNKALKKFAKQNGCKYYDFTGPFKDKNGNLLNKYDGGDGCHWKPSSCKLFIEQMKKYVKNN